MTCDGSMQGILTDPWPRHRVGADFLEVWRENSFNLPAGDLRLFHESCSAAAAQYAGGARSFFGGGALVHRSAGQDRLDEQFHAGAAWARCGRGMVGAVQRRIAGCAVFAEQEIDLD